MEHDPFNQVDRIISQMLDTGSIEVSDAQRYRQNFRFFHEQKPFLERTFKCNWVASIEGHIYDRYYREDLYKFIAEVPFSNRAYIEHIHPGIDPKIGANHNSNPPRPAKPNPN